ncbi:hypothetical protein SMICM17S_09735 [Streptomyces microflavus]
MLAATLIAAETARYGELPPRWRAQLDELPGPAAAPRDKTDRFGYASDLLELYRLLLRLPAIEPVGPVPGTAADHLHRPPPPANPACSPGSGRYWRRRRRPASRRRPRR